MREWLLNLVLGSRAWRRFARRYMAYFTFRIWGWPQLPKSSYFIMRSLAKSKLGQRGVLAFVSVDKQILNYKVNHWLTGCRWGHAGLVYWGADAELRVMHMLNNGFNDDYLIDLMGECDGMALMWLPMQTDAQVETYWQRIADIRKRKDEINYDYQLDLDGKPTDLYCSELVLVTCQGLTIDSLVPRRVHGVMSFTPDDLYKAGRILFDAIY